MERARSRALLGALAAELGHEVQGPLNLFRSTVERVEQGAALDGEDVASLREELERLARLSARLRQLARPAAPKQPTSLGELIELGLAATSVPAGSPPLLVDAGAAGDFVIACDRELLALALAELCTNALEARQSQAGLRFAPGERVAIVVWDDGPGFSEPFEEALAWGRSTRSGRAGIGLTLALRAARAHGFTLECRRARQTEVWLMIPHRVLAPSAKETA